MSALDDIITRYQDAGGLLSNTLPADARAELAALRDAADELARIRELVDPLDGQSVEDAISAMMADESSAAYLQEENDEQARRIAAKSELINMLVDYTFTFRDKFSEQARRIAELEAANAALREAVEQAYEIILSHRGYTIDGEHMKMRDLWLTEHFASGHPAPAQPQAGDEAAEE